MSHVRPPHATLAAPAPKVVAQVVLVALVLRAGRRTALTARVLLALASGASFASGFFDGQLGRADLTGPEVALQVWLISVTLVLGVLAAISRRGASSDHAATPPPTAPTGSAPAGRTA